MFRLSDEVREMERNLAACRAVLYILKKQHIKVPDEDFKKNMSEFRIAHVNRVLQYCPFPDSCNQYDTCEVVGCNADECSNGFAFRRS